MMNNDWHRTEIDLVARMAAQGASSGEIADRLPGRTRNAVIGFCYRNRIDLHYRKPGKKWTKHEDGTLRRMIANGVPVRDAADKLGRTHASTQARVVRCFGGARLLRFREGVTQ